jgi:hypothetical protein
VQKKRPKESSPDPGQYVGDVITFGKDVKANITFGEKYKWKPDSNPPVGAYEIMEAMGKTSNSPRTKSVIIKEATSSYRRPKEHSPDPGAYVEDVITFGKDVHTNITFGEKYKFKADNNPPVGAYDITNESQTKFNNRSVIIREDVVEKKRPKEHSPDPGQYTEDVITFGKDVKTNITFGDKYKWKPDSNPPVGAYDIEAAESQTKF